MQSSIELCGATVQVVPKAPLSIMANGKMQSVPYLRFTASVLECDRAGMLHAGMAHLQRKVPTKNHEPFDSLLTLHETYTDSEQESRILIRKI